MSDTDIHEGGRASHRPARPSDVVPAGSTAKGMSGEQSADITSKPLTPPAPRQMVDALLHLMRLSSLGMTPAELTQEWLAALKGLYPRRHFHVELAQSWDHGTGAPEGSPSQLKLSRSASDRRDLTVEELTGSSVVITDAFQAQTHPEGSGFDIALMVGRRIAGVLTVEYPPDVIAPPTDAEGIHSLTHALCSALRDQELYRRSLHRLDYFSKLLDYANAPIMVIGRRRDIRVANRAMCSLTGLPKSELEERDLMHLLPDSERTRLQPVVLNALRGRPTTGFEMNIARADGSTARMSFNVASLMGPDGQPDGVIAIGHDLTQVRELEEQVAQAEKLATLGQLAAGVVHELNNPLTSISVYSDFLLKRLDGPEADPKDIEKLRRIQTSVARILRFTQDLVTYARPSTEQPERLAPQDIVEQALVFCEHVIAEIGVEVDLVFNPDDPRVYGVRSQLHQVFINLITNACHAMPEGAGRLGVRTEQRGPDLLAILLSDNGAGVPPDLQNRIFEPFFTTKEGGKGTGLGLSIVRKIVTQHGGDICLKSELGAGATFIITLPTTTEAG